METVHHPLEPVWDSRSRVLILGTMPSPKSREAGFYYGHPRNRFWPALAAIFSEEVPLGTAARRAFCLRHRIALWDVLASCEIQGASDSSIHSAVPNPIGELLEQAPIEAIFTTGQKAFSLYQKLCLPMTGRKALCLPSTSPANCAISLDALIERYQIIKSFVDAP